MSCLKSFNVLLGLTAFLGSGAAFAETINVPGDYTTVPAAIEAAKDGDTIVLADDTYLLTEQLVITNAITLKGSAAEKCILKQTQKSWLATDKIARVIMLNNADARVENVTITGGSSSENWKCGGGVLINSNGGTVSHCIISNNLLTSGYQKGGGVYMKSGRLEFCKVIGNQSGVRNSSYGGGVACIDASSKATMPVIDSCLIADNYANEAGGGVYAFTYATILNTTIADNTTDGSTGGGGLYIGTENFWMTNCLIAANTAASDTGSGKPNWATSKDVSKFESKIGYCLYGDNSGVIGNSANCLSGSPAFKKASEGDYHLTSSSEAIGKADATQAQATDLDGVTRDATPDIGCYEYDASSLPFSCEPSFSPLSTLKDQPVTLSASLVNPPSGIDAVYTWTFTRSHDGKVVTVECDEAPDTATLNLVGIWSVSLVVSDRNSGKATESTLCENTLLTGASNYYVTASPNEGSAFPYETEGAAATSLAQVTPYLVDGTTVNLGDGIHTITTQIEIENDVTIRGSSATNCIIKQTKSGDTCRVVSLNNANARVENVTITGGQISTGYIDGGGVYIGKDGGTVSHCIISNNYLNGYNNDGGGVYMTGGRLEYCKIVENYAGANYGGGNSTHGGGVACESTTSKDTMPVIESCLIADNKSRDGGGLFMSFNTYLAVLNTTIAKNTAGVGGGGGIYVWNNNSNLYMTNCIVAANVADNDAGDGKPNWLIRESVSAAQTKLAQTVGYTLWGDDMTAILGDATCFAGDPVFKKPLSGDYHLKGLSDAIGKACAAMSQTADLDGVARDEEPDLGCYEYDAGSVPFSCEVSFSPTELMKDKPIALSANLVNAPKDIDPVYTWTFTRAEDAYTTSVERYTGSETVTLDKVGKWTISLVVSDRKSSAQTESTACEDTLLTASPTNYVTASANESAAFPYDTPETAATSYAQVAPYLIDGSVVMLDAGTHRISNEIALSKGIEMVGAGRDLTFVAQKQKAIHRLANINHPNAVVRDITFTGVNSQYSGYYRNGYVVLIGALGGTVRDCRVAGTYCKQQTNHGAVALASDAALIDNVIIEANTNECFSMASYASALYMERGTARNCLIRNNAAKDASKYTVYMYKYAKLENCTIAGNSDEHTDSAALYINDMDNATGYVRNCVFADNTLSGTTSESALLGQPNWAVSKAVAKSCVDHCCWVGSKTLGASCADGEKAAFVDAANGDYRLTVESSCRNAGVNADWMESAKDLDGNPRRFGRRVDIGAYELQNGPGFGLIVR